MKLRSHIFAVLAAALVVLLPVAVSCSGLGVEEVAQTPELSFKRNPEAREGGSQFISVSASTSWTLSVTFNGTQKDWLTITPISGEGSTASVMLKCTPNESEFTRKAVITIRSGGKMSNYTFTQNGPASDSPVDGHGDDSQGDDDKPGPDTPQTRQPSGWLELPQADLGDNYAFFTHYMTVTGVRKRNYSFYWSKSDMLSIWVAYPMNRSLIGSGTRPNPEPWAMDPLLKQAGITQPDVTGTFKPSGVYGRGHQIASADRYVGDGNAQTYYSSNMTPQIHEFNGLIWAALEGRIRDWSKLAGTDTCYVVTGCVVKGSTATVTSNGNGVKVKVPTAYYKAVIRHALAPTVGYGGYSGLAIILDHKDYGDVSPSKDMFCSIDELEKRLGIDLFANLPDALGQDLADKIEAEDPKNPTASLNLWW